MAGAIKIEDLNPRISLSVGVTLPSGRQYQMVRAEVGMTIDKPLGMTMDDAYRWVEADLVDRLVGVVERLQEAIE